MTMTRTSVVARSASTVGIAALLLLSGGTAAQAVGAGTNSECSGDGPDIAVSNVSDTYVPGNLRIYGDSGAVLSIESGQSSEVHADVSVSGTVTADAVVASASVTAGVTLGVAQTITQSASASYTVPEGLNGQYIELGSAGKAFSWTATTYNRACVVTDTQGGNSVAPTANAYVTKSW
ncbi:hypothetical protein FGG90_12075 [Clavibacter tessellarius]|uniref:Uncharacterized protein n=1 Tax=Clavibacter tessellarius TaxID=31965 RepID=A0A154V219_9MICO|nr:MULTISPECIES: hypothetical protein [Clavibacter]KZC95382.1 hypothetical protein AWH51_08425 [Clavibacter michiganensis subsp. tessellarius]MDA3804796.1 hypothetical protein [Clavibacter sp. CT19]OQJ62344.1 hypothetical protein B5P24_04640 [Clavibacter michiganensis subsp. tessellarius]UKF34659.1 hypothetical protein FGG90_12075 [Clavibacter michiganensis subsp. tessellarius]